MLGIQTDRTSSAQQIDARQVPADSNSEMKYPVVEGQLSITVNHVGQADPVLALQDPVLPLSATTHRGPLFTSSAPDPVLVTLMQYVDNEGLRTMAGDPELTAGMQHLRGFDALAQAVLGQHNADHEFETAQIEKADDPSNVHAFDNARLRDAYKQHVANTHRIRPAVKSAIANGASALTKVAAVGFTYAAAIEPGDRVGMSVVAGVNWFNALTTNLAACDYRRTAAKQRKKDMAKAVSLDLDRLGTEVTTANRLVNITLEDFRAFNRSEEPDAPGIETRMEDESDNSMWTPSHSSSSSSSSSSSTTIIHVNEDGELPLNPQS